MASLLFRRSRGMTRVQKQKTGFMKTNTKNPSRGGFTLIELIVAIFIFSILTISIVSVFASTVRAYSKSRAIKTIKENTEFAMNSIAKDVRMGKIESAYANGSRSDYFLVTRNRNQIKACYKISSSALSICENSGSNCASCASGYENIVDLSGTGMSFDTATSGFYSLTTDPPSDPTRRGWVEMNLDIIPTGGVSSSNMDTDAIHVQTIVSSRDYGWEDVN